MKENVSSVEVNSPASSDFFAYPDWPEQISLMLAKLAT